MHAADTRPALFEAPPETLAALADRINNSLAVARALVLAGRTVDLGGLQDGIGVLCAKTLDLPGDEGRRMLPLLHETLAQLDSMARALRAPGQG